MEIGDHVEYYDRGCNKWVPAVITGTDGRKNDQQVYVVQLADGVARWGYPAQVRQAK